MEHMNAEPHIFHILRDEALEIQHSSFGSVGKLFSGEGIEAVWVKKEAEEIDPDWFSQPMVDLILVVQGKLKMEFERTDLSPCVLEPGDLILLPPETRCRAYRWPREVKEATVFLAVYTVK
jgi:hypothetical protein